jgi:hypothetical protein
MTHKKNSYVNDNVNLRPLSYIKQKYVASIDRATYEKLSKETEQNYSQKNSHYEKNPIVHYINVFSLSFETYFFAFVSIFMASSQPAKGRGRGRGTIHSTVPQPPSNTPSTDISASVAQLTIDTSQSSDTPATHELASTTPTTIDTSRPDTGFSSASRDTQSAATSSKSAVQPKGRGTRLKPNVAPDDPHWTVTNLTRAQFDTNDRPKKPDELGTLGEEIQVIVNYFPILQFPHTGLVYRYNIQIRNKKNFEIHRDRRR